MTRYLRDRKHAPETLGRVLVLGLGRSGKIVTQYCTSLLGGRVESLCVAAGAWSPEAEAFAEQARARGARVLFDHERISQSYDLCIASPGISQFSDFYRSAQAASIQVIGEVEFAWRESSAQSVWAAVSGTNGKTTTTSLVAHLLKTAGMKAAAVGNIGDTCLAAVAQGQTEVYVAEVSSYQLASTVDFAPDAAVLLNITPDHLSWHRSHENYVAAKYRLLANLARAPHATAVLDASDETVRAKVRELRALSDEERGFSYIPLGTSEGITGDMRAACGSDNAAFLRDDGMLVLAVEGEELDLVRADELLIPGAHNIGNALAAACAALALGADAAAIREGLRSFTSLPHRIEACGTVGSVQCYNDSKATNVDATLKAISAFEPRRPIVLLGGEDKFTDLAGLVAACELHCKAVVCFGASRERFLEAFEGARLRVLEAEHLQDALDVALAEADRDDIVVLSPACASFDEFDNFEQRGEVFKKLVAERAGT